MSNLSGVCREDVQRTGRRFGILAGHPGPLTCSKVLVYGDPSRTVELHGALRSIEHRIRRGPVSLDALRDVLIQTGQLEQAIADAPPGAFNAQAQALRAAMSLTDRAASAFVSEWLGQEPPEITVGPVGDLPNVRLTEKVPEGFAFYTLYPEQYCAAATKWAHEHSTDTTRTVVVVGVRSIGTCLSAIVSEVLARAAWKTNRITVRPTGHPFNRQVDLDPKQVAGMQHAIVVDEGPGLSGSSMAACGKALVACGIAREAISFFPGHGRMPGSAASSEIRDWWTTTPRTIMPLEEIRWGTRSVRDVLADATERLRERRATKVEDFSGGRWRGAAFPDQGHWPAIGATFERTKYRVLLEDGSAVLWKFAGLPDGSQCSRQSTLAAKGFTVAPVGDVLGFVGSPWIDGARLRRDELTQSVLERFGAYIRASVLPPPDSYERRSAFGRLQEMVRVNVREALGDSAASRACEIAEAAAPLIERSDLPAYGDGRMAPHEWVRTRDGHIFKTDCCGHDSDHTIVATQSVLWDVAGALVEWDLVEAGRATLLKSADLPVCDEILIFYELAYAAFRTGFCTLCAGMTGSDVEERDRLIRAGRKYLDRVRTLVQ